MGVKDAAHRKDERTFRQHLYQRESGYMFEDEKGDKIVRVLQIYAKLADGYIVSKSEEARNYGVKC